MPFVVALMVVSAVTLRLRWRLPMATIAICGGCALAILALGHRSPFLAFVPSVALYSLAVAGRRAMSLAVAAVTAVVVAGTTALAEEVSMFSVRTTAHVALVACPVLVGEVVQGRRAAVALRLERAELLLRAERESQRLRIEQERRRIARDLHDVVGHALTTINVQAGVAAHLLDNQPEFARQALREISTASGEALRDVRGLVGMLREPDGARAPVGAGPRLSDLPVLVEQARRMGVDAILTMLGDRPTEAPESVQVAAYRIVQEALTNVRKHAGEVAATVEVEVGTEEVRLRVWNTDGGAGQATVAGAGLVGMRERTVILGGNLQAGPAPSGGFEVLAHLPLRAGPPSGDSSTRQAT